MRRRIGELWIGLGLFHLVVVGLDNWGVFADMISGGFVNTMNSDERVAAVMMFILGVPLVLIGLALRWAQRHVGTVPQSVGWVAAPCFLAGAIAQPVTGAWLIVALAIFTIVVARQDVPQAR